MYPLEPGTVTFFFIITLLAERIHLSRCRLPCSSSRPRLAPLLIPPVPHHKGMGVDPYNLNTINSYSILLCKSSYQRMSRRGNNIGSYYLCGNCRKRPSRIFPISTSTSYRVGSIGLLIPFCPDYRIYISFLFSLTHSPFSFLRTA